MHITLETDYAIRIVYVLAKNNRRMYAKSIAEETSVTLRFSLKILRKLVAEGIVKSFKGTQGGYEIDRDLDEISLYDIVTAIEGPIHLNRCGAEEFICTRKPDKDCPFHRVFNDISNVIEVKLKEAKFSKFVKNDK
ncbi:MAG: Rrf2 family transcriptional regulator [Eubacteriales bacterium]|nr:Rrf2 family transcriptional regulator [Eubacteriales bacterium]